MIVEYALLVEYVICHGKKALIKNLRLGTHQVVDYVPIFNDKTEYNEKTKFNNIFLIAQCQYNLSA